MRGDPDKQLLETVRTRRARLTSAFFHGELAGRRRHSDNVGRLIGSVVLAAVLCAACAGYSFVQAQSAGLGQ